MPAYPIKDTKLAAALAADLYGPPPRAAGASFPFSMQKSGNYLKFDFPNDGTLASKEEAYWAHRFATDPLATFEWFEKFRDFKKQ